MSLQKIIESHAVGIPSTWGAILLNVMQADFLNKVLTLILSALSIVYMVIQIYTALPKVRRAWRMRNRKKE